MIRGDGVREFPVEALLAVDTFFAKCETDEQRGEKIWNTYEKCKSYIIQYINPLWKDTLDSGENETGLLHGILEKLWPLDAREKAKSAFHSRKHRCRNSAKQEDLEWLARFSIHSFVRSFYNSYFCYTIT